MSNTTTEAHHDNHFSNSAQLAETLVADNSLATLVDYLMEHPFREKLDDIFFSQCESMLMRYDDFEDFAQDHLVQEGWEDQRWLLMDLADRWLNDGKELRRIVDATPEYAIPLRLAKAHAAAIANAEAAKANAEAAKNASLRKVEAEIDDFWEAEEQS